MNCPSCGHDNAPDAAFCDKCGSGLVITCTSCGRGNPPDSAFCAGCGHKLAEAAAAGATPTAPDPLSYTPRHLVEKILRDRGSLVGERRTVTVLFSDAMGFTPLSERIGEEEVYTLMQECTARMMDAVHRYEGTITQFTGDGVMALFGAPIAHEDSARRAVAAALEMQKSLGEYADEVHKEHSIECSFRVGLNTGPVVVGSISDNLDMDYTALGDTVNLASRMESLAEPGTVYLTEETYRVVKDYFECESLGALAVKGKAEPVVAYRAMTEKTAVRTRFHAATERGLTPLVGREQELRALSGYFEQVKRGQGQVVFLSGEAGLGKSRLLLEFRRSLLNEPLTWIEGQCIAYGQKIPYLSISDLIKNNFGVEEGDSEERIIERIDDGTATWDEAPRATTPYLKYLLSVDPGDAAVVAMDPRERRAGVQDGLRALLRQESRHKPLVVVIEDLHWIDENSGEALGTLADVVATAPVLMILSSRPDYTHALGERTYFSRIALSFLPPEESAAIAERMLQTADLPKEISQLITSKGEGNPFYIEEVTKSLVESGVLRQTNGSYRLDRPADEIRVPDTIQEVILSRIDRLEREAKEAIQRASVIGREFAVRLLNRISDVQAGLDDSLNELKALELIYATAYFPELAYMFKHALTHDVAYSTLLVKRRKALHRLVGTAIEELYADRLIEQYEALAYHYYEGQEWEKALDYLEKAGDKATAAYANQDALDYYAQALEVCEKLGDPALETASRVAEKRAMVNLTIAEVVDATTDFDRMVEAARALEDRRQEGMALVRLGLAETWAHNFGASEQTLRAALAIGDEGHSELRAVASLHLGTMFYISGRLSEAAPFLQLADEVFPEMADSPHLAFWVNSRGFRSIIEAQYGGTLEHFRRWGEAAEVQPFLAAQKEWIEAMALAGRGEYQRALAALEENITTCERVGEKLFRVRALNTVGWIHVELQNHEEAIRWNVRSEEAELPVLTAIPEVRSNARLNLGDSLLALGRVAEAEEYYQQVERVVRSPQPAENFCPFSYPQHFFHSYGELWLARGDNEKALSLADECVAASGSANRPKNVVKGRRLRGQALLAQGKLAEAETEIDIALGIAKEIGNPPQLWKTYVALGDLRKAQGEPDQARKAYREAYSVIESVAEGLTDEALRETFLTSPHVRGIREAAAAEPKATRSDA
ncbi:MAG: AAA family ATPase [Chloroflexi bacterium]|nr:AAA family ATPase [Chloroflexota bacterium]